MACACSAVVAVPPGGCAMPRRVAQLVEALAVLGEVDRVGAGAEHRDARRFERARQLQRRLAAERDDTPAELAAARSRVPAGVGTRRARLRG